MKSYSQIYRRNSIRLKDYDYSQVELDLHQIMPNHFHGSLAIVGATLVVARPMVAPVVMVPAVGSPVQDAQEKQPALGDIIGTFKSITTNEYVKGVEIRNWPRFYKHLWQRSYYDHVVRDEADLERIRNYILSNPANWSKDEENPNS